MSDTLPTIRPGGILDYRINAPAPLAEGETVTEAGSSVTVTGATKDSQAFNATGVTVWLSGAAPATLIKITALLRTTAGRTFSLFYVIPYGEPVSLEQAKAQCKVIDDDSQDELIAQSISAARGKIERYTGHALVRREFVESHTPERGVISLYRKPVISAVVSDLPDTQIVAGRLFPASGYNWPSLSNPDRFEVTYTAGYAEGEVPPELIRAILIMILPLFERRAPTDDEQRAINSLCDDFRDVVV
jgi:uncharacterized phiE125 gp8 family phage protein